MLYLPVDQTSADWRRVTEYVAARVQELTMTCIDPSASERDRLEAAVRIDELRELARKPEETRAETERRMTQQAPVQQGAGTY